MNRLISPFQHLRPTQIIALGFLTVILVGTLLLMLPVASADGTWTPFTDALFSAATSVCVTGLTVVSTANHWSLFGQIIILLLIQLGGMGVVTMMMMTMLIFHRRIGMKNRILLQTAYGWDSLHQIVRLTKKVVIGTLCVEGIGALCYLPVLVRKNGIVGIWQSLFLSISAFCNAGMDIIGDNSLADFRGNVWMNGVTMLLIILGGLGFLVWWELIRLFKEKRKKKITLKASLHKMSLHTKIVLITTAVLLAAGTLLVFVCEFSNPDTLGSLSLPDKLLASVFQSVTTRTAGFYTIPQDKLGNATALGSMFLMLIGGSPGGTEGGVKTVTVAMVFVAVISSVKGREETRVFHRSISDSNVKKGLSIIMLSLSIWFVMTLALCALEQGDFLTVSYETMSAIGTVGLSRNFTGSLHTGGKLIITMMMYLGRIGPITMAAAFLTKKNSEDFIHLPEENIMLG